MAEIVIGVDGGTTAVKAVAFNLSGDVVSTRRESVSVTYGDHGEAEQDMNRSGRRSRLVFAVLLTFWTLPTTLSPLG